jgi:hypothetical protein
MALLVGITLVIYRDVLTAFFWHDDFQMIKMVQRNSFVEYLLSIFDASINIYGPIRPVWRPLTHYVYWAVSWRLFGSDAFGYHLITLLIHVVNVLLVYRVAKTILHNSGGAFATALFYTSAVLVHFEALYHISVVNELGMTTGLLLSFWCYLRWRQPQGGWSRLALSISAFAVALLCKEASVVYPAMLAGYELLFPVQAQAGVRGRMRQALWATWPFWLVSLGFAGLRLPAIAGAVGGNNRYEFTFGLWVLPKYFWGIKWLFEVYLAPLQRLTARLPASIPVDGLFGATVALLATAGLAYFTWGFLRQKRAITSLAPVVFGVFWFAVMPLSIIFARPFAAYFFMTPGIGVDLAAGSVIDRFSTRLEALVRGGRLTFYAVLTSVSLILAAWQSQSYVRNPSWMAQQGRLSRAVITWMAQQDLDYSHIQRVYFVGFPSALFATDGEPTRSADALELYLGMHPTVVQLTTFGEVPAGECAQTLVLAYDADTLVRQLQPTGCEPDS